MGYRNRKARLIPDLRGVLASELEQGFIWSPVVLALGILIFFEAKSEPPVWALFSTGAMALVSTFVSLRIWEPVRPIFWCIALLCAGFALAGLRSQWIAAPVLEWRYYGPVEGRVIGLDRSGSGALRVTLDHVVLDQRSGRNAPARVRISLYGKDAEQRPIAGARVMTTAHISPPAGPAEPGGFDFQRHAWFSQIGGVGYTRVSMLYAAWPTGGFSFFKMRLALSARIQTHLDGQTGAFAAALLTGDRSGLSQESLRDLRLSNLAHLLAISGLHMGLLVGFVFTALRFGLSLIPQIAAKGSVRKLASIGGLIAASGYLGLSGGSVATERAFVMASVALAAVLLERRAISLRAVALAALMILVRRPEAVTGPGFQMSFAATTALVVVFNILTKRNATQKRRSLIWRTVSGTIISSTVAGLATLPIAAAHFNLISHFGLVANLVSVPLMGIWVIPLAVIAFCLMPFGLEWLALDLMGFGLDWILAVAHEISHWQGSISRVVAPPGTVFFTLCFGLLCLALMATRFRLLGLVPVGVACALWGTTERPDILISDSGALVGVLANGERVLSKSKGSGFVAGVWLENDGDMRPQDAAAKDWRRLDFKVGKTTIFAAAGKTGLAAFKDCRKGDLAVFSEEYQGDAACEIIDRSRLQKTGSIAIDITQMGLLNIKTARDIAGRRYWNDTQLRQAMFGP